VAEAIDWVDPPAYMLKGYGLFAASQVIELDQPYPGTICWEQDACTMSDNWALCVAPAPLPTNTGAGTLSAALGESTPTGTPVTFTITGMAATTAIQVNPGDGQPLPASVTTDGSGHATVTYTYLNPGTYNASASNADGTNITWTQVVIATDLMPKVFSGPQYGSGRGFAVYNSIQCNKVGLVQEVDRAKRRLMYTEERQAEFCLMTGQAGNYPYLAGPQTQVLTPGSGVLSLVDALGWLEGELGEQLGPQGIIHASRYLAPSFAESYQTQLVSQGDQALSRSTTSGTKIVFGSGYPAVGPDGKAPTTGTSWLYASGPIAVRRGPVIAVEVFSGTSSQPGNQATVVVERQYVIEMDCPLLAVQCQIPAPPHLP
jgi:hypothetical protein